MYGSCKQPISTMIFLILGGLVLGACTTPGGQTLEGQLGTAVAQTLEAHSPQSDEGELEQPPQETVGPPLSTEVGITSTPPSTSQVHAEGTDTLVKFPNCFDLDTGALSSGAEPACDFTVSHDPGADANIIEFAPSPPAGFGFGGVLPGEPNIAQCEQSSSLSRGTEVIVPLASMYVCYQTREGRYGYLTFKGITVEGVTLDWRTYDPPKDMTTIEPLPTSTQLPTSTPSNTPSALDPDLPTGEPDWKDSFDSGVNWSLYENDHVGFEIESGNFILKGFNADHWDGWLLSWPNLTDFYLEATFTTGDTCSGLDRYGMVARQTKSDEIYIGYLFGVSCDARYSLRSWEGDEFEIQVPWTSSGLLRNGPNQTHRLGFLAKGDRLVLYSDGQRLKELNDNLHSKGKFGFWVASANTVDFIVEVEEIAYWNLP